MKKIDELLTTSYHWLSIFPTRLISVKFGRLTASLVYAALFSLLDQQTRHD